MILLDTCVISEVVRRRPDARVMAWFESVPDDVLFLSALTLGELRKGIALKDDDAQRVELRAWADGLERDFHDRILDVDVSVATHWGRISAEGQRAGTPVAPVDGLIAATALRHGMTLATRNTRDFRVGGVMVINPWGGP